MNLVSICELRCCCGSVGAGIVVKGRIRGACAEHTRTPPTRRCRVWRPPWKLRAWTFPSTSTRRQSAAVASSRTSKYAKP